MKKFAAVFALLAIAALAAFGPPTPKTPRMTGSVRAAGTVVWVKWTISATPSDTLTVDLSATNQPSVHRSYLADSKTDSISYPKPAPGASISGTIVGKNWRAGRSAMTTASWGPYIEPDTVVVAPKFDSLRVFPSSVTLAPGQTQQFCPVAFYSDGTKRLASCCDTIPYCQPFAS